MNVSLAYLDRCSAETQYSAATLEKVIRLGDVAGAIARHPVLKDALVLKGGTAFNLCLGDAPMRLSVDLDYNYIAHADREIMRADRPRIEDAVKTLVQRLGFRIQQSSEAFAGHKIYAYYRSVLGPESRIEVDLNYLWRVSLGDIESRTLWQPGDLDRPHIRTVSLHELALGKILAFLDRTAPRDVYDMGTLAKVGGEALKSAGFRGLFVAFSATLPHPLPTYRREVIESRLTAQAIQEQLVPMLTRDTSAEAGALIESAWQVIEPLVLLAPNEQEYVAEIHEGNVCPRLLFPEDDGLAEVIANHPAILWKTANVVQHRNQQTSQRKTSAEE